MRGDDPVTTIPLLQLAAISKRFPGVIALDRVDFDVAAGEIVALVGHNGAGKSTLLKILAGIHRPDAGAIQIDGVAVAMQTPADATQLGIGVIHQELELVDTLDVAGNVFLGREPRRGGPLRLLDRRRMEIDAERQLARIGAAIPPRTPLRHLSPAQQQLVAIARALSLDARLLILDEPTSSLGSAEADRLFGVLRDLRAAGTALVYVSHRLKEIEVLADRAVVLRDGRRAGSLRGAEITRDRLVHLMVGRPIEPDTARPRTAAVAEAGVGAGSAVVADTGAAATHALLHIDRVRTMRYPTVDVSLTVHAGEVLGIAGLMGAGRSELAEALCGLATRLSGRVLLEGRPLAIDSPRAAIRHGVCLVPEDRRGHGVIAAMSVRENLTLPTLGSYARWGLVRRAEEARAARDIAAAMDIRAASLDTAVATLSGGNQQKVVLGKWLGHRPRVVVLDEPTQGVDVGAKAEIHRLIRQLADEGTAVMLISSDLEEVVAACDRVAVMHDGRITGILDRAACTPESIMQLAVA
jgi:ribose transport system ATP-binding protein